MKRLIVGFRKIPSLLSIRWIILIVTFLLVSPKNHLYGDTLVVDVPLLKVHTTPNESSEELGFLHFGLQVIGKASTDGKWFEILTPLEGHLGFVILSALKKRSSYRSTLSFSKGQDKKEQMRRFKVVKKNRHWPLRIKKAVKAGQILLQMTKDQVLGAWGKPQKTGLGFMVDMGEYEILYYKSDESAFVTLKNNVVTGWNLVE